uniref:Uncharacterized protein n=1 Tax=Oryza brachyantha TaxID=4533 RepID=J3M6K1_ORYBR
MALPTVLYKHMLRGKKIFTLDTVMRARVVMLMPFEIFSVLELVWSRGHRLFSSVEMCPTLHQNGTATPVLWCNLADIALPQYLPCQRTLLSCCLGPMYV